MPWSRPIRIRQGRTQPVLQTDRGWGESPSGRCETLAEHFRPIFAEIAAARSSAISIASFPVKRSEN